MYYLVTVYHNSMAAYLTRSDCEEFKNCCIPKAVDGTDGDMLWNDSEEGRDGGNECEEDEGTDCKDGDGATDL